MGFLASTQPTRLLPLYVTFYKSRREIIHQRKCTSFKLLAILNRSIPVLRYLVWFNRVA
ncbi:unknown protein [Microcystis aeruginosa NIES-843]|uniref:Uncharacterized protein n=1 Tax=Microcystis aeruginosa (strain NIES-843 / IAM M-2473) TaxID=449447 RepID=B0JW42_MICAN|nr:unknown protein [Microcystis aeruginosa NIES-843]